MELLPPLEPLKTLFPRAKNGYFITLPPPSLADHLNDKMCQIAIISILTMLTKVKQQK